VPYPKVWMSSRLTRDRQDWPRIYLGIFFTTLATLILELSLTRLFSVVFYYHFAFLAISIAMFGLGAGGLCTYLLKRHPQAYPRRAAWLLLGNAIVIPLLLRAFVSVEHDLEPSSLVVLFFGAAVPFFLSGIVLSTVISETISRVDRVYFFDLLGAAAGCLLLVPFLNSFGGANTVLAAAVTYAAAASLWFSAGRMPAMRALGVGVALLLVCLMVLNGKMRILDVQYAKGKPLGDEMFVKWNSFSRVALRVPDGQSQPEIVIDGDASTGIPPYDVHNLSEADRRNLLSMGPGVVHNLRPGADTLVIGAGGGWDVARALAGGSESVTGVEINATIARTIMQQRYPELSQKLYFHPAVKIVIEDGRSFVRRSRDRFGVIQLTLVDTWASTAAGAFALTENNLYTTEAFVDYLRRLAPDGILSFTRWGFTEPRESLRLLALARAAFQRLGVDDISSRVLVLRENSNRASGWGALDTILICRSPLQDSDIDLARRLAAEQQMELVYAPSEKDATQAQGNAFAELLTADDANAFYETYPFDVSPVSDNRPFFFYTVQPRELWAMLSRFGTGSADYNINRALPTLFALFAVSLLATALVALVPLLLSTQLPRGPRLKGFLLYFACIGAGYILVQIAAIQRFVLLLGQPTYSLTVIVFSMLVCSGLGSFFSSRIIGGEPRRLRLAVAAAAALIALLGLTAGPLSAAAVSWPTATKIALTVVAVGIPAFAMGIPFPRGLDLLERWHAPAVRWAWALNAAASVLGSVTAIVIAVSIGLRETMLAGCLCYIAAMLTLWLLPATVTTRQNQAPTAFQP
jgi:spermidine synthase